MKSWIYTFYCLFITFALHLTTPTLLLAQDGGEGGISLTELILRGGIIGGLVILLSIIALALIIEHFLSISRDELIPPDLVAEVDRLLEEEEFNEALDLCEMEPSYFTNVMASGIAKIGMGIEEVEDAIEEAAEAERTRLHNKISWLSLIGNLSPMMGLLGTVVGMIQAFQVIADDPNPDPSQLASGIYQALITTAMGLVVAIPVLSFYFFFRNRLNRLFSEAQLVIEEMLDQFKY